MTNLSSSYRNNGEATSSYEVFSCMLDLSRLRTNRRASHLAKRAEVAQTIAKICYLVCEFSTCSPPGCQFPDASSQFPVLLPSAQFRSFQISSQFCIA